MKKSSDLHSLLAANFSTDPQGGELLLDGEGGLVEPAGVFRGARELHGAFMQAAFRVADKDALHLTLVVDAVAMSTTRLQHEWDRFAQVLRPEVATRLALSGRASDGCVTAPINVTTRRIAELMCGAPQEEARGPQSFSWNYKRFEVFTALFNAWLRNEGALPIHTLVERAGTSYPPAAETIRALELRGELARSSSRAARLTSFPRRSLEELVPRLHELRDSEYYVDGTGGVPDLVELIQRLQRLQLDGIKIGGVTGARSFFPQLNLNGTPRVDVVVNSAPKRWLWQLDPALEKVPRSTPGVVLAVHHTDAPLLRTGPASCVFDLYDLGLSEQAEDLVRHLTHA